MTDWRPGPRTGPASGGTGALARVTLDQIIALVVLVVVVGVMIHGRLRSDVVALSGAAALLLFGVVRPVEVQGAFASPAIMALAGLFVIAYAMELSGLLAWLIRKAKGMTRLFGRHAVWIVIGLCGAVGGFLNNTPVVVLAAPVVRDMALSLGLSPKRFLMPLSYAVIMGGLLTLIGTSTNLLVSDMARNTGQPVFSLFEITGVGLCIATVGGLYLYFIGSRVLEKTAARDEAEMAARREAEEAGKGKRSLLSSFRLPWLMEQRASPGGSGDAVLGNVDLYEKGAERPLELKRALASLAVFAAVVGTSAFGLAPIAASAFAGAVALILMRVITAEEAYAGLRPEILLLVAGMVVIGSSLEVTGLAQAGADALIDVIRPYGPWAALFVFYGVTLFATDILSNATVAVLFSPIAVAIAAALGVDARPFLVAVMMAASAAFATPFSYQTNVLVYQMGNYSYMDFVKVGLPLNLITWATGMAAIPIFFPF